MKVVEKSIKELVEYAGNPRLNEKAIGPVMESIRAFGFKQPIVIDRHNVIIAGHTRYCAAVSLGLEMVPCVVADDLTEDEVRAYRIADNRTNEFASWDNRLLDLELQSFDAGLLDNTLFAESMSKMLDLENWKIPDVPGYQTLEETAFQTEHGNSVKDSIAGNGMAGIPKGVSYKEKFGVVVDCENEVEQRVVFELVHTAGYKARIVSI